MFRYLLSLLITIAGISFLSSCNKNDNKFFENNNKNIFDFEIFSISLIDNTLIFENEKQLNACFEYLNTLGDDNFDEFESILGYVSYRTFFAKSDDNSKLFSDELYATLLNPEGKIIVGKYLLHDLPNENQICAFRLDNDFRILNKTDIPDYVVTRDQDIFEEINNKGQLKSISSLSYCNGKHPSVIINDFGVEIKITTEYNKGIFHFLKAKISRPWCIGCGLTLSVSTRENDTSFWIGQSQRSCNISAWDSSTGTSASIRINTKKLIAYNFLVDYSVSDETQFPYPYYQTYNGDISCNSGTICY